MLKSLQGVDMLEAAFAKRYPSQTENDCLMRTIGLKLCRSHLVKGLGDQDAERRLCSENDETYWQQLSEVVIADLLNGAGLKPSHESAGPDFLIDHEGTRVWIEVICPTPAGIPNTWLNPENLKAYNIPHEALLLRWTSAIKEKAEKLIGTRLNPTVGYLQKRYVGESDAYVIAINGRLLRAGWPQLEGISQWPLAVEATFSVGPYALTLDRESLQVVDRGHQHRPVVPKPNGALVPADTFLDPRFAPISAVWAMDFDELSIIGRPQPMAVVHNPAARNPLPPNLLPAFAEYVATIENRYYNLERRSGRLGDISEV